MAAIRSLALSTLAVAVAALFASPLARADGSLRRLALEHFAPLPAVDAAQRETPEARLGRALFWDTRLSADGKTACASCHPAQDWGSDRRRFPIDARGKPTTRHSQTVFNAMGQPTLRWTGDRPNGAAQAEGSMTGSLGFATKDEALAALATHGYAARFAEVFAGDAQPLTLANFGRALAAYQATLVTPSPFDRFLAGDDAALTPVQQAGLRRFVALGCSGCHRGALLGGASLQRFAFLESLTGELPAHYAPPP